MSDNRVPNLREACKFADDQLYLYIVSGLARNYHDYEAVSALITALDAKTNCCGSDLYTLSLCGMPEEFNAKAILRIQNQLPRSKVC